MSRPNRRLNRDLLPKKSNKVVRLLKLGTILVICIFFVRELSIRMWTDSEKMIAAFNGVDGRVRVVVIDPEMEKIYDYSIPGNTEVDVARNLGRWKLGSVWKLGEQEKVSGGSLLAETITSHLMMPVYLYGDSTTYKTFSKRPNEAISGVFSSSNTNIRLFDRIRILYYSATVKNADRVKINLEETRYLQNVTISTGESGYEISDDLPISITDSFANNTIQKNGLRFLLIDGSGSVQKMNLLGSYISVIGGKVASIEKKTPENYGCVVSTPNSDVAEYFERLFNCAVESFKDQKFDVVFSFGKDFLE